MFNYLNCVKPLLNALGWQGSSRRIFEVVPHLQDNLDLVDLRNMMVHLGFVSRKLKARVNHIDKDKIPCLFISHNKKHIFVIHHKHGDELSITDCETGERKSIPTSTFLRGHIYTFHELKESQPLPGQHWLYLTLQRFRPFLFRVLGWSFFISLLSLITPIFMRAIYDFVIPSFSSETLVYLGIGLGIALLALYILDEVKAKVVAYVGARLDVIISTEIMRHLLFMPMQYMEGATVAAQVARLRQFDMIREVFTGPFAHLLIEIPFILIFIIALAVFGGPVAFVPIIAILVYVVMGFLLFPNIRQVTLESSRAVQERRTFFIETIANLPFVKQLAAESVWLKRYRETGAHTSLLTRKAERMSAMMINLSQIFLKISGVATILWATLRVIDGTMSPGSLMAVVILVWKALSPIHVVFLILSRLDQIRDSINQVNRLMTVPTEKHSPRPKALKLTGHIKFSNVTFRYPSDTTPAIQGINFEVPPGEILAVIGNNGSGKTTLAKLLLGLYPTPLGQVTIDGMDVRQFDPIQLRQSIGYAPHLVQFFHGSIAQNMRLVNPEATEEEIISCLEKVDLRQDVEKLPKGLNTRIDDRFLAQYSSGFLQKLNLARALVRKSNLLILDEPGNNLDLKADEIFKKTILDLKGKATIICITHRPSLVNIADRVLMLHNGFTRAYGPRDKVLAAISGGQV